MKNDDQLAIIRIQFQVIHVPACPHNASYKHMTQGVDSVAFQGDYCATGSSGHYNNQATLKKMMEAIEKFLNALATLKKRFHTQIVAVQVNLVMK